MHTGAAFHATREGIVPSQSLTHDMLGTGRLRNHGANGSSRFRLEFHNCPSEIETEWRAFETSAFGTVFQSYDWCLASATAARHAANEEPLIVVGRSCDDRIAFIWPMALYCSLGVCSLRWLGQDRAAYNMGLYRRDILRRLDGATLEELLGRVAQLRSGIAVTRFKGQPLTWDGEPNPFAELATCTAPVKAFVSTLHADFDNYVRATLSSRQRKVIRAKRRKLEGMGAVEHQQAANSSERLAILEVFMGQKGIQLAGRRCKNVYADDVQQTLYRALALAENFQIPTEFHALSVAGQPVATLMAVRFQGVLHVQAISMTSGPLARYSPGVVLMHDVVRGACAQKVAMIDFGPGEGRHKSTWQASPVTFFETHRALRFTGAPVALMANLTAEGTRAVKRQRHLVQAARAVRALPWRVSQFFSFGAM